MIGEIQTLDLTEIETGDRDGAYRRAVAAYATRGVAWDCLLMGVGALAAAILLILAGLGFPQDWQKVAIAPLTAWLFMIAFSIGHEALHGNLIRGGRLAGVLNASISTLFDAVTLASWHGFRFTHLEHHRFMNDPVRDPNWWMVARRGLVGRTLTVVLAPILENAHNLVTAYRFGRVDVLAGILATLAAGAVAVTLVAGLIGWKDTALLWLLPAWLNYSGVVLFVSILPHGKQLEAGASAAHDTIRLRHPFIQGLMTILHLGHNYHTLHHLYPRVPMHRFGPLARRLYAMQAEKMQAGLDAAPLRPAA